MHKVGASSHALVLPIYTGRYFVSVFEYLTLKANHNGWGRRADRASKKLLSADKPFKTANYAIFKPCVVTSFKYRALSTTLVKLLLTFVGGIFVEYVCSQLYQNCCKRYYFYRQQRRPNLVHSLRFNTRTKLGLFTK